MTLPVPVADARSWLWRQRFLRPSAALGEEAITSDLVLALEEEMAPFVTDVYSFSRSEEGGTHGQATGADIEIHFTTPDGLRHLGYRIQAKKAKVEFSPATHVYDLKYTTAGGVVQIDALINAAKGASCTPLYWLYNSPDAVRDIVRHHSFPSRWFWDWDLGCGHHHDLQLDAALTISSIPARLARYAASLDKRKFTPVTFTSPFASPWSCLFHQGAVAGSGASQGVGRRLLTISTLTRSLLESVGGFHLDDFELQDEVRSRLAEERRILEELIEDGLPEDVRRLWAGSDGLTLDALARERRLSPDDDTGDTSLHTLLVIVVPAE